MGRGFVSEIDLLERIRLNIRARRAASAWSVGHAAKRAGMHARHWQKLEACEVNATLRTLSRIAIVFGVDAAELVATPPPLPPPDLSVRAEASPKAGAKATKKGVKVADGHKPARTMKATKKPAKAGSAKAGSVKAGAAKAGSVKAGAAKAGSAKAGAAKAGSVKAGAAKAGSAKAGAAKAGSAKAGAAKAGSAKAAVAKPDGAGKPRAS